MLNFTTTFSHLSHVVSESVNEPDWVKEEMHICQFLEFSPKCVLKCFFNVEFEAKEELQNLH